MSRAYYNEIEPYCVEWLKNLIAAGEIAPGDVDSRRIEDVQPNDLTGYTQCHFFAGLGGWSLAARLAGWPDARPLWTGSCPCQPFSVAGRRKGVADERHLWPHFYRLIRPSRPPVVMGEQVAGAPGYAWLDGVGADLEAEAYTWRAVDIPACSVNAPEIRNRLYWVARAEGNVIDGCREARGRRAESANGSSEYRRLAGGDIPRLEGRQGEPGDDGAECAPIERGGRTTGGLVRTASVRWREGRAKHELRGGWDTTASTGGATGRMGGADDGRCDGARLHVLERGSFQAGADTAGASRGFGFWDKWVLIGPDPEGKYRRIKPGIALLDSGIPSRVAKLRAIGNAICPELAAEVIRAYMETERILEAAR